MILLFIHLIILITKQQPCTAPTQLIGTTAVTGSCASDVSSTTSTDFNNAALGGSTLTTGVTKFAISMWIKPGVLSDQTIATYCLFRVTTDVSDTIPSTPKGVRFSAYFQSHTTDFLRRGFQLGYSETPSTNLVLTDITEFLISYNTNWIFLYAALNYETGDMYLSVWQTSETFYKQKGYQASKVNFNDPLDANTQINLLYFGSYVRFCGNVQQVNWMPGYYETIPDNIIKLAYYLEGKSNTKLYLYRFDTESSTTATNLATSATITLPTSMTQFYYEISNTNKLVELSASGTWAFSDKAYTLAFHILFKSLPVNGQDIVFFQRINGSTNKLNVKFARQTDGTIGIVLTLQTTSQLIFKQSLNIDQYYYIVLSISFKNCINGFTRVLVYYQIVGQDGDYTKHGYTFMEYTSDFSTQIVSADKVNIGSTNNVYPNSIYVRNFRFQQGFDVFTGSTSANMNCVTNCRLGVYTLITSDTDYCLLCDTSTKLDSTYLCATSCTDPYFPITDLVSSNYCNYCGNGKYVSTDATCIAALCGNGFQESGEECDDGNTAAGDGCSATCQFEAGYICNVIPLKLSTCVKQCGNGQQDTGDTASGYPAYSEQCDDGNVVSGDGCSSTCTIENALWECLPYFPTVCTRLCGNGTINNVAPASEQCDDGNTSNSDGCNSTCQIEIGWYCNTVGTQSSCNRICGNGIINAGEACDDGNLIDGDGCTNCVIDAGYVCSGTFCTKLCGNGVINAGNGEICDDGNTIDYDGCTNCQKDIGWTCVGSSPTVCQLCGNGKREGSETCDDANTDSGDGCSSTCFIEAGWTCNLATPDQCNNCGDGKKQQIEECDDGNSLSGDGCYQCKIEANFLCSGGSPTTPDVCVRQCPNGLVAANEQCDDGNFVSGDGCYNCMVESGYVCSGEPSVCTLDYCGNGMSNTSTEQCDDGNTNNGDGCSSTCLIEAGWKCVGQNYKTKSVCSAICGDGKRLSVEQCDDGNLIDGDGCSKYCKVELSYECTGGSDTNQDTCKMTCGDNLRTGIEQCDDGNKFSGDGCSNVCQIETGYGCQAQEMPDGVMRDECFKCISNCAVCTDTTVESCSLCIQGYYLSSTSCTNDCGIGYYGDFITQKCSSCSTDCNHCYSSSQCYNCKDGLKLYGVKCVSDCLDGYFVAQDDVKGNWCKKCPNYCKTCTSETICTLCDDYYSVEITSASQFCRKCELGELCLKCDFSSNQCVSCQVGYRPIQNNCILIEDKCGDGLLSLNEECDDGNNANGDGCSATCVVESNAKCRTLKNEGPSECYSLEGWKFSLKSFILYPQKIQINFQEPIMYNEKILKDYSQYFSISITGFDSTDYSYSFVNITSNQSLEIEFKFQKNVVSQTLTVKVINETLVYNKYGVQINNSTLSQSIALEDIEYYSDSQLESFEIFQKIALTLQILNWILVVGAALLNQKYRMWKIIEMMQIFAVLYYVTLRSYPLNDELILRDLRYSNLSILPNPVEQQTDQYLDSLRRFSYAGMTHQILNNAGGRFLISLAISFAAYILIKIIYNKTILFVLEVFLDKLEFSYFFKLYEVFLLELLISSFHNLHYNSMATNWDGTNTVISLILLLLIGLMQITQLLIAIFRNFFGTQEEIETMFGTLTDGFQDEKKIQRMFASQFDFVKKFFIAYAMIYVSDSFEQVLFIVIPRATLTAIAIYFMNSWFVRVREIVSELLLYGVLSIVYLLAYGNFIGDLDTKITYGWFWLYLVIAEMALHSLINTYMVWKLLQELELLFPKEVDPSEGLNKKVDLFRVKPSKGKKPLPNVFLEDLEKKVGDDEAEEKNRQKLLNKENNKNQNREAWNVWDMDREAKPEERKFVSINHNELNPIVQPQQINDNEIINFDDLDNDQPYQNDPFQMVQTYQQQQFGVTQQQQQQQNDDSDESSAVKDNPFDF